jgi:uncharacterized protein
MLRNAFAVSAMVLLISTIGFSQTPPTAQPNTLQVGAEGKFESAPDMAIVQFNISAQENTPKAAYARASRAVEQIHDLLRSTGLDPKSAEIGTFSVQPVLDWSSAKRKLVAYIVTFSVAVKFKDLNKVNPIVQGLVEMDITDNQSVGYLLENIDAAKSNAIDDAYRHAREDAEALAHAGGRTLTALLSASVDTTESTPSPIPMYRANNVSKSSLAEIQPPTGTFSAQRVLITAHVTAVFGLK